MIRGTLLSLFALVPLFVYTQAGKTSTFAFMKLTSSARVAALGGSNVSIRDDDLNLPFHNPALLNNSMSKHLVINYVNYFAGINYGYVSYGQRTGRLGTFAAGIHYISYGDFLAADESGFITGSFTASEYAFNLLWSAAIDSSFQFGVNLKPVYSVMESYRSTGLAADVGLTYTAMDGLFCAGLVLRNLGTQLKTYHGGHKEPLPFGIEAGASQKLRHAPFRFSLTAHDLQRFDLRQDESKGTQIDPLTGEVIRTPKFEDLADQLMHHFIFGVEFMPLRAFHLRFGYNYLRRQQLKIDTRAAAVGFSWGFGLNVSGLTMSFGRASYHLAGATSHFSLSTDLARLFRKKVDA